MIILLVILSALFFYLFGAVWVEKKGHVFWAWTSLAVLVASVTVFALHDVNHLGMKVETTTKTVKLASVNSQANLLVYKQLGTGKERVYVYKTSASQKKTKHTWIDADASTKVTSTSGASKLVITKRQYVYSSKLSKLMFGILGDNKETKSINYNFKLNSTWAAISTTQAAKLQKALKDPTVQAQLQTQVAAYVKTKLTAALEEDPTMSAAQQAKLQKQYTNEAKAQALAALLK